MPSARVRALATGHAKDAPKGTADACLANAKLRARYRNQFAASGTSVLPRYHHSRPMPATSLKWTSDTPLRGKKQILSS